MDYYYDIVKRSRALLLSMPKSAVAAKTAMDYEQKTQRLLMAAGGDNSITALLAEARKTKKAASWFGYRAALSYMTRKKLDSLLVAQDKAQRALRVLELPSSAAGWTNWRNMIEEIEICRAALDSISAAEGPAIEERTKRHSKRNDLRKLPADWREKMIERMPHYWLELLTTAVVGCRPAELQAGIYLEIERGFLVAHIDGVKVTNGSGQPWRRLFWSVDHSAPLVQRLIALIAEAGGELRVNIKSEKNFHGAMRAAGNREWPGQKFDVTPYCLRHQAAADFKSAGSLSSGEISAALGHCSDATKTHYGHANMGSANGVAPTKVEAAREVRIKPPSAAAKKRADVRSPPKDVK